MKKTLQKPFQQVSRALLLFVSNGEKLLYKFSNFVSLLALPRLPLLLLQVSYVDISPVK